MVNNEGIIPENDDSETDDDDEKSEKSTTQRVPRHVPLPSLEEKKEESKPRLSFSEQLFQKMVAKKEADKEEKKELFAADTSDEDKSEITSTETPEPLEEKAEIPDVEVNEAVPEVPKESEPSEELAESSPEQPKPGNENEESEDKSAIAMEAADWEAEGEIDDEGEINLSVDSNENGPVEPDEEVFAERPVEPLDTRVEPTEETGPVEPELLDIGLASEEPPEPPEIVPPATEEEEPDEPEEPSTTPRPFSAVTGSSASGPWYDAAAAEKAHQTEIEDAEYYAEKRGLRKGLGAGLFFGWMFGRHGKKKAAREHAEELKKQNKEFKQVRDAQSATQQRTEALKGTVDALQSKIEAERAKTAVTVEKAVITTLEQHKADLVKEKESSSAFKDGVTKSFERNVENTEAAPISGRLEQESKASPEKLKAQKAEVPPEEREITESTYSTPEDRRVETSAWHRIEMDKKTGRAVIDPEVEYGDEFKHERAQEIKREDVQMQSGIAVSAASQLGSLATSDLSQVESPAVAAQALSAKEQAELQKVEAHRAQLTAGAEMLRYASMPIVWIAAVLIVVVLFMFGILR